MPANKRSLSLELRETACAMPRVVVSNEQLVARRDVGAFGATITATRSRLLKQHFKFLATTERMIVTLVARVEANVYEVMGTILTFQSPAEVFPKSVAPLPAAP